MPTLWDSSPKLISINLCPLFIENKKNEDSNGSETFSKVNKNL
jgi:hypothetical protein